MLCVSLRRFAAALLLVGLLPTASFAQEGGQEDGPESQQQQLPEIAPQEIEIRGELQVSFPTLERQPLRGFRSPREVPSVPPDHTPYVASYKQRLDELPESLPAPDAATASVEPSPPPKSGFLQMGGGRYASRFANGHLTLPLTDRQTLTVDADYFGTAGFSPFPDAASDLDTPADQAEGRIHFESRHDALSLRLGARGSGSSYTLYGRGPAAPTATVPERSSLSGGAHVQLQTHGTVASRVTLRYDGATYDTQLPSSSQDTPSFRETRLGLEGSAGLPLGGTNVELDLAAHRSTYGGDVPGGSGYDVDGGLSVALVDGGGLTVRAGGRVLTFSTPVDPQASASPAAEATYILPSVRAEYAVSPSVTLYAQNRPRLTRRGLTSLYRRNPFGEHAPSVRPTLSTTRADGGARLSLGVVRLQAHAGYQYAPSYQYFVSSSPQNGSWRPEAALGVRYGSVRRLHAGAELALRGIAGVEASLGVRAQDGVLVGPDVAVPHLSPVVADAMVSISFADRRGLIQATGTVESPRPVGPAPDAPEVGTYAQVDFEGSYGITRLLDVVVEVRNLSTDPPERWAQYPRPPTVVMGGFRIHW